jgi:hypothetical protein
MRSESNELSRKCRHKSIVTSPKSPNSPRTGYESPGVAEMDVFRQLVCNKSETPARLSHASSVSDKRIACERRLSLRTSRAARSLSRGGGDMRLRGELDRYSQCSSAAYGVARRYVVLLINRSSSRPASSTASGKPRKTKTPAAVSSRPRDGVA